MLPPSLELCLFQLPHSVDRSRQRVVAVNQQYLRDTSPSIVGFYHIRPHSSISYPNRAASLKSEGLNER
jgi:hypothetical protein